ncbi:MAG: tRNA (N6-isopentenyl adenosine(37)-C2)-methylthiotransferase MiaB [Chitinivibrionales bacterium]|nr:tRNA (N6-isopentenyl adenosine(37)-C2)-methylthiotransferase MiaB [Chitinivibrionales bacterium]
MLSVHFETFGCQMNVADSEMLADLLAQEGYRLLDSPDEADLVVVNTCSVRAHAEDRARARITDFANAKRKRNPDQQLWVMGCMAQRLGEQLRKEIPGVDRVIGAMAVESLHRDISEYLIKRDTARRYTPEPSGVSCFVPIMRGCDNYCAYCIVPYVRGHEHSLEAAEVARSVRSLVERGVKEVTLLGQNVNSYHDRKGSDFPRLLRRLHEVDGLQRIRFTTSHPKDCGSDLIDTVAELPKLCKHFHLPVQSGSTHILRRMNRGYTRDDYLRIIERIREAVPQADITTDVMTGFPGERESDFEETMSLFRHVRFTTAFMFAFSPRTGTAAASMPDQLPAEIAKKRLNMLIELQTEITRETYKAMVGNRVQALITERQQKRDRKWMGRDHGCKRVLLACSDDLSGTILDLNVTGSSGMTLLCERAQPCDS